MSDVFLRRPKPIRSKYPSMDEDEGKSGLDGLWWILVRTVNKHGQGKRSIGLGEILLDLGDKETLISSKLALSLPILPKLEELYQNFVQIYQKKQPRLRKLVSTVSQLGNFSQALSRIELIKRI
ncbi:hypothetical protein O181_061426 [Austropuccinia psidii MF-1]|uniref:Uncharacterized protein n=1 Tax=Austropuccinia psidii MF-1 TaxID=1389203 RepID=A0A9Q3HXH7_9BASI|nr:hypothetical protein [Austropuccinia psidii MF-1]